MPLEKPVLSNELFITSFLSSPSLSLVPLSKTCFYFTAHLCLKIFSMRKEDGPERPGRGLELILLSKKR